MATVSLTWTPSADSHSAETVYRSTTASPSFPGDYTQIASLGSSTGSYDDTNAPRGETVLYAVTATSDVGESAPLTGSITPLNTDGSVPLTSTTEPSPTNPVQAGVNASSIAVSGRIRLSPTTPVQVPVGPTSITTTTSISAITIGLPGSEVISGVVLDKQGSPVASSRVYVWEADVSAGPLKVVTTDANGEYECATHPAGDGTEKQWHVATDGGTLAGYAYQTRPYVSAQLASSA